MAHKTGQDSLVWCCSIVSTCFGEDAGEVNPTNTQERAHRCTRGLCTQIYMYTHRGFLFRHPDLSHSSSVTAKKKFQLMYKSEESEHPSVVSSTEPELLPSVQKPMLHFKKVSVLRSEFQKCKIPIKETSLIKRMETSFSPMSF